MDDLLGRRWKEEVPCLEAVKNWVAGDLAAVREKGGRLGVVKLEMSFRSDEEWREGEGEGKRGCAPLP